MDAKEYRELASIGCKKSRFPVAPEIERTVDGIVFASKREAERYSALKLKQRAGIIIGLVLQPEFVVLINGAKFCTFTADFAYSDVQTGKRHAEDVKSTGTQKDAAYRLRKKAAELYFGIKIEEVLR